MRNQKQLTLWGIAARTAAVHTVTYFAVGLLAFNVFDYSAQLADPTMVTFMRQADDPLVQAGVLFQPIRGVLFGFVFYLLREVLFGRKNGWLIIWISLIVIGVIATFGTSPGSIEGFIYTRVFCAGSWGGMIEVLSQSFLLSSITYYLVNHPEKKWLNWLIGGLLLIVLILPVLGLLSAQVRPA